MNFAKQLQQILTHSCILVNSALNAVLTFFFFLVMTSICLCTGLLAMLRYTVLWTERPGDARILCF